MSSDALANLLLARARIWRGERGGKASEAVAVLPLTIFAAVFVVALVMSLPFGNIATGDKPDDAGAHFEPCAFFSFGDMPYGRAQIADVCRKPNAWNQPAHDIAQIASSA